MFPDNAAEIITHALQEAGLTSSKMIESQMFPDVIGVILCDKAQTREEVLAVVQALNTVHGWELSTDSRRVGGFSNGLVLTAERAY